MQSVDTLRRALRRRVNGGCALSSERQPAPCHLPLMAARHLFAAMLAMQLLSSSSAAAQKKPNFLILFLGVQLCTLGTSEHVKL